MLDSFNNNLELSTGLIRLNRTRTRQNLDSTEPGLTDVQQEWGEHLQKSSKPADLIKGSGLHISYKDLQRGSILSGLWLVYIVATPWYCTTTTCSTDAEVTWKIRKKTDDMLQWTEWMDLSWVYIVCVYKMDLYPLMIQTHRLVPLSKKHF